MPRCDLLVWIIVTKLAPCYYIKLDRLLIQTGRYRELCSWRKDFKKEWRSLEKRQITLPLNNAYNPNATEWVCTCPTYVISHFLICKHLVQEVHRIPPHFFLEVKRQRKAPFWRHESLKALNKDDKIDQVEAAVLGDGIGDDDVVESDSDEDQDQDQDQDQIADQVVGVGGGQTFQERLDEDIDLIINFAQGLRYQAQFRDQRLLSTLEHNGVGLF
jgi:hypothetical protein